MTIKPFTQLSGVAASIPEENIDTDVIYPARFLLITAREGLGEYAFHDRRFTADGQEIPDFVLNCEPWRNAPILVAGANFGSGSSREQAVWALLGRGIRCVIAPSFGEIFHANCYRNGVLPITLPSCEVEAIAVMANAGTPITVDLPAQQISAYGFVTIAFDIAPDRKEALLNGWDETAMLLNSHGDDILAYETRSRSIQPWLFEKENAQ